MAGVPVAGDVDAARQPDALVTLQDEIPLEEAPGKFAVWGCDLCLCAVADTLTLPLALHLRSRLPPEGRGPLWWKPDPSEPKPTPLDPCAPAQYVPGYVPPDQLPAASTNFPSR